MPKHKSHSFVQRILFEEEIPSGGSQAGSVSQTSCPAVCATTNYYYYYYYYYFYYMVIIIIIIIIVTIIVIIVTPCPKLAGRLLPPLGGDRAELYVRSSLLLLYIISHSFNNISASRAAAPSAYMLPRSRCGDRRAASAKRATSDPANNIYIYIYVY